MDAIKAVFEEGGFPGVVGVIDGTHIGIRAPTEDPDAYINRKTEEVLLSSTAGIKNIFVPHRKNFVHTSLSQMC